MSAQAARAEPPPPASPDAADTPGTATPSAGSEAKPSDEDEAQDEAPVQDADPASLADQKGLEHARRDEDKPLPGTVRSLVRGPAPSPREKALWIPRVLLLFPRMAFATATWPLEGLAYLQDRYRVRQRATDLFFNEAQTFGVFPTAFYETGAEPNIGFRLMHTDLGGRGAFLNLRAGFGGLDQQVYGVALGSGKLGGSQLQLFGKLWYRKTDRDRFYGLGNAPARELGGLDQGSLPLDPRARDVAVETRFLREEARGQLWLTHVHEGTTVRLTQWLRSRRFSSSGEGVPPSLVFDTDALVGYEQGVIDSYTELFGMLDSRQLEPERHGRFEVKVAAWAGFQVNMNLGSRFGRFGLDVQPFIRLFRRDRLLHLRIRGTWVAGPTDAIPFRDLSTLGGDTILRGFLRGRFFDRHALLTSVEYRYPINPSVGVYLFVDAGEVYPDVQSLSLRDVQVGYGAGFRILVGPRLLLRGQLATSARQDAVLSLSFGGTDVVRRGTY